MAQMSGISLAATVMDQFPDVGVVVLSGYMPHTLDLERVTDRGAMFLPKPVTSALLVRAVQRARAARHAGRDREPAAPTMRAPL